jgi:hypothetical protein
MLKGFKSFIEHGGFPASTLFLLQQHLSINQDDKAGSVQNIFGN